MCVTACSAVYTGRHPNGHLYTIYEVEAQRLDGRPIVEQLRSFEELPLGEQELNVVRHSDHNGVSFTLSRQGGSGNAAKIVALEERVTKLEQALERVSV